MYIHYECRKISASHLHLKYDTQTSYEYLRVLLSTLSLQPESINQASVQQPKNLHVYRVCSNSPYKGYKLSKNLRCVANARSLSLIELRPPKFRATRPLNRHVIITGHSRNALTT